MFSKLILLFNFALSALAASNSTVNVISTTTVNIYLGGSDSQSTYPLAGSIVAAGNFLTTIALACTSDSEACPTGITFTVTEGTSTFKKTTSLNTDGVEFTIMESCSLGGTTTASCLVTASSSAYGQHGATASASTFTGTEVNFYQVPITAGAEKLASATITSANAAPTAGVAGMLIGAALAAGALL